MGKAILCALTLSAGLYLEAGWERYDGYWDKAGEYSTPPPCPTAIIRPLAGVLMLTGVVFALLPWRKPE